jgi:transposase
MTQHFVACDRDQELLLPPNLRDWLPEDHLALFLADTVEELDLSAFYAVYRRDGHGRPAFDPAMMVTLLLYAYCRGVRSSRAIERGCVEDVAFRVIAANEQPDHATIARFRVRHEQALAGLFTEVLALCAEAGMASVGVVAVDGTKLSANASRDANLDYEQLARKILEEAAEIDAHEDELYGDARGDELPPTLARREGRRAWLREARQRLENKRAANPKPVPRSRPKRLRESKRRLEEELRVECEANDAYEAYRAGGVDKTGRRFGRPPDPVTLPDTPAGKVNTTDPDSRLLKLKARRGFVQGYNAQAVVNEHGIVIAAEIRTEGADFGHLEPMIDAARRELQAAGIKERPGVVLADAGYWHQPQMERLVSDGIQVLIRPDGDQRKGTRRGWNGGYYAFMRRVLDSELGGSLYRKRKTMIEPIFGHTKYNRRADRFQRRGRQAVRSEWRLITTTHNLAKLHRHRIATAAT